MTAVDWDWNRSSACANGACVEVRRDGDAIVVRDGKYGDDSRELVWSLDRWRELLAALAQGDDTLELVTAGGFVWLGAGDDALKFTADEWNAFVAGVKAGEFSPEKLSSAASEGYAGLVPVGARGGSDQVATGAGAIAVPPAPVAVDLHSVIQYQREREQGMTCGRCHKPTGNNHQGHYWKFCQVTKQMEVFHFCCPGDCDRATAWRDEYEKLATRFSELGITVDDGNACGVPPKDPRWVSLLAAAKTMDDIPAVLPAPVAAHHHVAGWVGGPGQCGVECACGTTFDGFDTIAEAAALLDGHIAAVLPAPVAADQQIATIKTHFTRRIDTLKARAERAERERDEARTELATLTQAGAATVVGLDTSAIVDLVERYGEARFDRNADRAGDLLDAIRVALVPVTAVAPEPRWGAGPLVEHVTETPAPEVWSGAVAPGGYVCGAPDPSRPDGICGMPVESEPCPEHSDGAR